MTRSVRMLVVSSDEYPPTRVDVAVLFGEEIARRGHRIDWILQSQAACARDHVEPWAGGQVFVGATDLGSSIANRIRKHARGIRNDLRLFGLLRKGGYDVIEVKDKFLSGIFAVIAARLFRKRFVYWLSYPFPEEYLLRARDGTGRYPFLYLIRGTVFKWLLYGVLLKAADHVFVQSEQMRRDVAAHGIALARMTAVPMGIRAADAVAATPSGAAPVLPQDGRNVLYLGTLARVRRLDILMQAMAHVVTQVPDARLYVVGRGDSPADVEHLQDEARRLGVAHAVIFVGQKPRSEALAYVRDADVCVSPFFPTPVLNSTSPTKLVEYMALGKAVVANVHPEQRLVIEESGAGIAVPWDAQAFADAIVTLLRDPQRRAAMGERGRRYVLEHRTYEVIADVVERQLVAVAGAT